MRHQAAAAGPHPQLASPPTSWSVSSWRVHKRWRSRCCLSLCCALWNLSCAVLCCVGALFLSVVFSCCRVCSDGDGVGVSAVPTPAAAVRAVAHPSGGAGLHRRAHPVLQDVWWRVVACCAVLWRVVVACCAVFWRVVPCYGVLLSVECCGVLWRVV
jgi:hypothetical protein